MIFFCAGTGRGAGRDLERVEAELGVVDGGSGWGTDGAEDEEEVGAACAVVSTLMSTTLVETV